jgi:hypothetical protein
MIMIIIIIYPPQFLQPQAASATSGALDRRPRPSEGESFRRGSKFGWDRVADREQVAENQLEPGGSDQVVWCEAPDMDASPDNWDQDHLPTTSPNSASE